MAPYPCVASQTRQRHRFLHVSLPPFQAFLDAHADEVLRLLAGLVGRDQADDCFQETFIAALRAYPTLAPESNLRAWVLTIARRKAIDRERARARAPVPRAELEEPPETLDATPEARDADLWQAVRDLPAKQRAAVVLRFVNDLSHREIAEVLASSEAAARRNLHEGLKTLRKARGDSS